MRGGRGTGNIDQYQRRFNDKRRLGASQRAAVDQALASSLENDLSGVTSVGSGTGLTGGPITTTGSLSLANTAVTAASYTLASFTVDAQGRLTAASSEAIPTGATQVASGAAAGELWATASHATLPDNVLLIGV